MTREGVEALREVYLRAGEDYARVTEAGGEGSPHATRVHMALAAKAWAKAKWQLEEQDRVEARKGETIPAPPPVPEVA